MKKALSLILALVMCLSLCACGGVDELKETIWVKTSYDSINDEGNIITHGEYVYNEDGEIGKWGSGIYKSVLYGDDFINCTYEYDFDEHNNLTEMCVFENGKISDVYTFNSNGYITEITSYYSSGKQAGRNVYEYDEAGRLVTSVDYMDSGKLNKKILYTYREDGTCQEYSCYEEGDVLLYITDCDALGRPFFTKYYNSKAPTYSYKYEYDTNGNLTEEIHYFGNSNREQSHYRYTYKMIQVTPLQKMIIEAKNKLSV